MKWFIVILILLPVLYFVYLSSPASTNAEEVRFIVPLGEKKVAVLERLKKENFVKNETVFSLLASFSDLSRLSDWEIEPGAYILKKNSWLPQTVSTLLYHPYQKWILLMIGMFCNSYLKEEQLV